MKILIAGGSGFIGRALTQALLEQGHEVSIMSRNPQKLDNTLPSAVKTLGYEEEIENYQAVINLAGAGIADKRWTQAYKEVLVKSRLETSQKLKSKIESSTEKPEVFLQASAIGIYGSRGEEQLHEESSHGQGFLPQLCADWEASVQGLEKHGIRSLLLRIGIVLGNEGGALPVMLPPFKAFVGSHIGKGSQYMSWIHLHDLIQLILFALEQPDLRGPVNATAPEPVSNKVFSKAIAKALGRPCWPLGVPGFVLKLMVGEFANTLLGGQYVEPRKALAAKFTFSYPQVDQALEHLLSKKK